MRVLGFLLARDSPGIMRERERGWEGGKREKSSYGKRGRERERRGRNWTEGGKERERVEAQRDRVWSSFHYQRAHLNNNAEPPYRASLF